MERLKRIVWIYALVGFVWILLSDWLVFQLGSDRIITLFQNIKGWLFVLASATLIYILLAREWRINLRYATEKEQREQDFTYLFQKHPQPMWIYDRHTLRFMEVNQKALTMYGYTREEWLMMRITDIRPAAEVPKLMDVIQSEDRLPSVSGPWEHLKKDGSRILVDILAHEIHHQGRAAVLIVVWDVTEREATRHKLKEAEAQRLENERLRLEIIKQKELRDQRARFLSMITHEFRNPLAAIQSSTTLLQKYYERLSSTQREKHYQTIYAQIQRLLELIDDITELRDFDALEFHFNPTKADIVALCKDIVEEVRLTAGDVIPIDFACDIAQLEMILDVKLIRQAIGNLMSNAIKYSPMGGRITLALQMVEDWVLISKALAFRQKTKNACSVIFTVRAMWAIYPAQAWAWPSLNRGWSATAVF